MDRAPQIAACSCYDSVHVVIPYHIKNTFCIFNTRHIIVKICTVFLEEGSLERAFSFFDLCVDVCVQKIIYFELTCRILMRLYSSGFTQQYPFVAEPGAPPNIQAPFHQGNAPCGIAHFATADTYSHNDKNDPASRP